MSYLRRIADIEREVKRLGSIVDRLGALQLKDNAVEVTAEEYKGIPGLSHSHTPSIDNIPVHVVYKCGEAQGFTAEEAAVACDAADVDEELTTMVEALDDDLARFEKGDVPRGVRLCAVKECQIKIDAVDLWCAPHQIYRAGPRQASPFPPGAGGAPDDTVRDYAEADADFMAKAFRDRALAGAVTGRSDDVEPVEAVPKRDSTSCRGCSAPGATFMVAGHPYCNLHCASCYIAAAANTINDDGDEPMMLSHQDSRNIGQNPGVEMDLESGASANRSDPTTATPEPGAGEFVDGAAWDADDFHVRMEDECGDLHEWECTPPDGAEVFNEPDPSCSGCRAASVAHTCDRCSGCSARGAGFVFDGDVFCGEICADDYASRGGKRADDAVAVATAADPPGPVAPRFRCQKSGCPRRTEWQGTICRECARNAWAPGPPADDVDVYLCKLDGCAGETKFPDSICLLCASAAIRTTELKAEVPGLHTPDPPCTGCGARILKYEIHGDPWCSTTCLDKAGSPGAPLSDAAEKEAPGDRVAENSAQGGGAGAPKNLCGRGALCLAADLRLVEIHNACAPPGNLGRTEATFRCAPCGSTHVLSGPWI